MCPDCDGYETRDQNTVVIGAGKKAVGMALALTTWTDKIVICTNGEKAGMDAELLQKLKKLNIPVLEHSAAGDIAPVPQMAIAAAASGAIPASAIHRSLVPEERRLD